MAQHDEIVRPNPQQLLAEVESWTAKPAEALRSVQGFGPGDTVKVHFQVVEGGKTRIQVFQGTVLRHRGKGNRETFTVRRISHGVGIERTFPLHSSRVERVEIVRHGQVRRARLYYLRDRIGRATRVRERRQVRGVADANRSQAESEV